MITETVRPGDVVRLAVRNGDNVSTHNALVLAIDPVSPLTSDGYPSVELVSVNLAALHHAGTSDFDKALIRGCSVVHASHQDFVEGRTGLGYMVWGSEIPAPSEPAGELTESGKRWNELHAEFAAQATAQYFSEYPEHASVEDEAAAAYAQAVQARLDAAIGTPSAADLDAAAEEEKAKEATAAQPIVEETAEPIITQDASI